jgi:radical SAM protein (TIGR01212 family)
MLRYHSFNDYLKKKWGCRVQRIPLDAGFGCPHRLGEHNRFGKGCLYCEIASFSPQGSLAQPPPLRDQICEGIRRGKSRYGAGRFIAYFQAFTNTYAPVPVLKERYDIIEEFPEICGLAIATRPDCVDEEVLDLVESYSDRYETWIEYGLQSADNETLARINRGHTVEQFIAAVGKTARRNISMCVHVILGLPGEKREQMLATAGLLARLPIHGVKIHHCHVVKGTELAGWYLAGRYRPLEWSQYVSLVCDFLERLPWSITIHRLVGEAPSGVLLAPRWALGKHEIVGEIQSEFDRRGTFQGARAAREGTGMGGRGSPQPALHSRIDGVGQNEAGAVTGNGLCEK